MKAEDKQQAVVDRIVSRWLEFAEELAEQEQAIRQLTVASSSVKNDMLEIEAIRVRLFAPLGRLHELRHGSDREDLVRRIHSAYQVLTPRGLRRVAGSKPELLLNLLELLIPIYDVMGPHVHLRLTIDKESAVLSRLEGGEFDLRRDRQVALVTVVSLLDAEASTLGFMELKGVLEMDGFFESCKGAIYLEHGGWPAIRVIRSAE